MTSPGHAAARATRARLTARIEHALFFVALLALWQFGSGRLFNRYYAGSPAEMITQIYEWTRSGYLPVNLLSTILTTVIGFVVAAGAGLLLATAFALNPLIHRIGAPFLDAAFALPKVVLAPLFIVWLGIGFLPSLAMSIVSGFFFVFYYAYSGMDNVSPQLKASARIVGATPFQVLTKVTMPAALPSIVTGLNQGLIYCFHGTIVGEMTASNRGIGYMIVFSATEMNVSGVLASVTVLGIVSLVLTRAVRRIAARLPGSIDVSRT